MLSVERSVVNRDEFLDLGTHCSNKYCNQLDFLPFKCSCCDQPFCQDHWKPLDHACSKFDPIKADNRIPSCPLCNVPVSFPLGTDPNVAMDAHLTHACRVLRNADLGSDPSSSSILQKESPYSWTTSIFGRQTVSVGANGRREEEGEGEGGSRDSMPTCQERRCKTKMIVPIKCHECGQSFCASHRYGKDHSCSGSLIKNQKKVNNVKNNNDQNNFNHKDRTAVTSSGLAALRRAQFAIASSPNVGKAESAHSPSSSTATANQTTKSSQPPQRISQPERGRVDTLATNHPSPLATAKAALSIPSQSDKRASAEQVSARKALEARAKKGLLTEDEKLKYATDRALDHRAKSGENGCEIS